MSLGIPTGNTCIAGVISAVPPEPPKPRIAATSVWAERYKLKACAIASIALPLSPQNTAFAPRG